MSQSNEIVADEEHIAEALQGARDSTSCKNGVRKRSDSIRRQTQDHPKAENACSTTDCPCGTRRKCATIAGSKRQEDCHGEGGRRPPRIYRAVQPTLQSPSEPLQRYRDSPLSQGPWLPEGLLQDPPIVSFWTRDATDRRTK